MAQKEKSALSGGAEPMKRTASDAVDTEPMHTLLRMIGTLCKAFRYFRPFLFWLAAGLIIGLICGLLSVAFSKTLSFVTSLRASCPWLLYLLPAAGVLIVLLYRCAGVAKSRGTNLVLLSIRTGERLPLRMAPLIFVSTALTHLCGGSAGREGAALQIGGSIAQQLGRLCKLDDKRLRVITMCGMSACFSALFGTPIAASIFAMEVVSIGVMYYVALVPCVFSAFTAAAVAKALGLHAEAFPINTAHTFLSFDALWRTAALAGLCSLVSIVFCLALSVAAKAYSRCFKNPYFRIIVGGMLVAMLGTVFGSDYLGAGMNIVASAVNDCVRPEAFALKILFTALTLAAGFKGGEIVPTLFIGATFGAFIGPILGLEPGFCAAVGMISLFCGVTNCPIASLLLGLELFGPDGMLYYTAAIAVSYMLSGYYSLYSQQKILYSKETPSFINIEAK